MIQQEKQRKRQMMSMLNEEYNHDMQQVEAQRQAEIDAKKNCRPKVYGDI